MENGLMYGIQVMVIGMGVVFASLFALSYVMVVLDRYFGEKPKSNGPAAVEAPPGPSPDGEPALNEETEEVPAEVVVAIASSLAAYFGTTPAGVRIRVIRRQPAAPSPTWSMAGRQELMKLRQFS